MRIGIDMLAVQSSGSRLRGIGRFGSNLITALLARDQANEYIFYAHDGYPIDQVPEAPNARLARLRPEPAQGERHLRDAMNRLARANPDGLDALLLISPFELCPHYDPPARPLHGPTLATVMHDLIPFIYQEKYLDHPANAAWFYRRLRIIRQYDALLTNSEATRADCLRLLGLAGDRVVTIGGAGNGAYFRPDRSWPPPYATRATLQRLGIRGPFVFCVAGADDRKNIWGLLDAFAALPPALRLTHQVVVTCFLNEDDECRVRRYAADRGLSGSLVLTGEVPDETLRVLYQRCAAFAFPSLYEGLGLPLLEAMHCGAAVLAGNNSSQIEVVGDAGILVNASDPAELAARLAQVLVDREWARSLGARAIEQAARFSWDRSAGRTLETLTRLVEHRGPRARNRRARADRPRIAVFSPWTPKGSGISDYAARLVNELKHSYTIDLYHEPGYVPEIGLQAADFACHDYRLFDRHARAIGYRGVLYQMGNSFYHGFIYETMLKHPGIVTLHDFCLSGFQFWRAHLGGDPFENLRREVEYNYPDRVAEFAPRLRGWTEEPGGFQEALARRGLYLNRGVFDHATAVVVHSPWCLDQARTLGPEFSARTEVIPMGARPRRVTSGERAATRARFGLPIDALILGSFGILTQGKMNVEAILAFRDLAREEPSALLIFVGQDWENGQARRKVEELGLIDRVRFLGRQADAEFQDLIGAVDLGISLRRPPTYGETSAALLDLLRHGIPTIVTDVATFSSYPDSIVSKVRWPDDGLDGLSRSVRELALDRDRREALGRAAYRHVIENHAWAHAAGSYADLIERLHAGRTRGVRAA